MKKIGILGGGQLGRMLLQAAANYPVETFVMENDPDCPSAHLCHHFVKGNIQDYEAVLQFGKGLDALTIEIEAVNIEALEKLEAQGVKIYPSPAALKTIKNKILQKQFYKDHQVTTADFVIVNDRQDLLRHADQLPAVNKIAQGGYDGRGVQILKTTDDFAKAFDAPGVLEQMIPIHQEISQIVAINESGDTALFPPVDMVFDPDLNLLDYQISPADIDEPVRKRIESLALSVVRGLKSPGLFAVEMFIDSAGKVYVNETAPRVHNSGHHTIEGNSCSQFDMLWRILLGYPLGNPETLLPSALVNLLGEEGHQGKAVYAGLDEVLAMPNVFVHIYGKSHTKPGRKMGHVTILDENRMKLTHKAHKIRQVLRVKSC